MRLGFFYVKPGRGKEKETTLGQTRMASKPAGHGCFLRIVLVEMKEWFEGESIIFLLFTNWWKVFQEYFAQLLAIGLVRLGNLYSIKEVHLSLS